MSLVLEIFDEYLINGRKCPCDKDVRRTSERLNRPRGEARCKPRVASGLSTLHGVMSHLLQLDIREPAIRNVPEKDRILRRLVGIEDRRLRIVRSPIVAPPGLFSLKCRRELVIGFDVSQRCVAIMVVRVDPVQRFR